MPLPVALKLELAVRGELQAQIEREKLIWRRSTTTAIRQQTRGTILAFRQNTKQVLSDRTRSGGARGVANAWRSRIYPERGLSDDPAGFLYTKAPEVISNLEFAQTITPKAGRSFLAIPTVQAQNFVKRGTRITGTGRRRTSRLSPANFPTQRFGRLRFVPTKRGGVLVADNLRPTFSRKTRQQSGIRRAGPNSRNKGRSVVMFVLVRQVRPRRKTRFREIFLQRGANIPRQIASLYENAVRQSRETTVGRAA